MADPVLQSPYIQEAIPRLGGVPNLITPMHAGTPTPMTLPGQQLPQWNLGEQMQKGVQTGQMLLKSKQIAAQAAAEAEKAKAQQQWSKAYNDYVQAIGKSGLPDDEKQARIAMFGALHGITPDANSDLIRGFMQTWSQNPPSQGGMLGGFKSLFSGLNSNPNPAPNMPKQPNNNVVRPAPKINTPNNGNQGNSGDGGNSGDSSEDKWW